MADVHDLVVLGLLMERPLHGYEISQLAQQWMSEITQLAPGTIYYTLKKLEKQGLVVASVERAGNRPERLVYAITEAGRTGFRHLQRESMQKWDRPYHIFDVGLFFFRYMEPDDLAAAIESKLRHLDEFDGRIDALRRAYDGPWPFYWRALIERARCESRAGREWFTYLRGELDAWVRSRKRKRRRKATPGTSRSSRRDQRERT
jgi:DNA-binding PadR family transcriptional regulator